MKKKWLKILVAAALIVGVSTGGYYIYGNYKQKSVVTSSVNFNRVRAVRSNLDVTVQATGTVKGANEVNIFSSNSGVIEQLNFKDGSVIKKGDLFCKINNDNQQQDIQTAQNTLNQKNIELKNLENNLDSMYIKAPVDGIVKSVFVSSGDDIASVKPAYGGMAIITVGENNALEIPIPFPQSGKIAEVYISPGAAVKKGQTIFKLDDSSIRNNIESKQNEIQQAQNQLSFKQENVNKSTIICPTDGIVSSLNVKNGDTTPSDKAMATIIDTSKMQVVVPVDELDIDKVKVGQKANITIQDIKDKTYQGVVESISQSGKTTNNVTTFDVMISVDNPERLKIGMNADVSIAVESRENVIAVPVEAIIERNGKKYVMVADASQKNGSGNQSTKEGNSSSNTSSDRTKNNAGNSAAKGSQTGKWGAGASGNGNSIPGKLVEVQTGIRNQTMIEILSGLTENQVVMIQLPQSNSANKNTNGSRPGGMGSMGSGMGGGRTR